MPVPAMSVRRELRDPLAHGATAAGQAAVGGDVGERFEHECPLGDPWVGQAERRPRSDLVAEPEKIEIERAANKLKVTIHASRPGIVIGRKGSEVEKLRDDIAKRTGREVYINIQEITKPEVNAQLVAENVATQLERRVAFRRAMRKTLESTRRFGANGVKLRCAGRLNGAEIARSEWYVEGRMPLHTLRADIDYGEATAMTTYGTIGVKVWVYHGDTGPERTHAAPDRLV